MTWLIFALLAPVLYAGSNIIDSLLSNRRLPSITALLFYASIFNLLTVPVIFIIDPPVMPDLLGLGLLVLLGFVNIAYLYPYYRALQLADTSVVVSLFEITQLIVPILAYFSVGEVLAPAQYVGFFLIVIAGALLTFDPSKWQINRSLGLMLIASLAVVIDGLVFKYAFVTGMSWGTAIFGQTIFALLWLTPLLFFGKTRQLIFQGFLTFKRSMHFFVIEEGLTFVATGARTYAISLAPLTFVQTAGSFQPVFVLILALVFGRRFPKVFEEKLDRHSLIRKGLLFGLMIFGVYLMAA